MRQISAAALPVAALVCGYPGRHRRRRLLLMMQGYIDDSLAEGEVLILAGLLATVERWENFSDEWQFRLDHARWPFFKMAEAAFRDSDEVWEHTKWHYYTIRDHVQGAVCVAIPLAPLSRAARRHGLDGTPAANPYQWAFKGVLNWVARNQEEWGLDEPVDFIFDERIEGDDVRDAWSHYLSSIPDDVRALTGRKPIFEDDRKVLPLQAADLWAWWCRKTWLDNAGRIPPNSYPVPWGQPDEIPQVILQWTPEDIDVELTRVSIAFREALAQRSS